MRTIGCTAALLFVVFSFARLLSAQSMPSGPERILFDAANRERSTRGIAPLRWDDALAEAARRHAQVMARQNAISHQFPGEPDFSRRAENAGAHFSAVAENVAVGPDAETIHHAWMESPGHRRNLLDPNLDSLGIAVATVGGQLFAVQDFDRALLAISLQQQEKRVAAQLHAMHLTLLPNSDDARRACAADAGYKPGPTPQYVFRYSTTSLDELPARLREKIREGTYHNAMVGACPSRNSAGLANYQLAVILFK